MKKAVFVMSALFLLLAGASAEAATFSLTATVRKADLALERAKLETKETRILLSARVANVGLSTAKPFTVRFELDNDTDHAQGTVFLESRVAQIAREGFRRVSASFANREAMKYGRICVDTLDDVAEANESNNCTPWLTLAQ